MRRSSGAEGTPLLGTGGHGGLAYFVAAIQNIPSFGPAQSTRACVTLLMSGGWEKQGGGKGWKKARRLPHLSSHSAVRSTLDSWRHWGVSPACEGEQMRHCMPALTKRPSAGPDAPKRALSRLAAGGALAFAASPAALLRTQMALTPPLPATCKTGQAEQ